MNLDNIFFNIPQEDEIPKKTISDITDSPFIWIGTFEKLILNYLEFGDQLVDFFKNIIPDLNSDQIKESGREMLCNKAFEYINKLDLNEYFHLESLHKRSSPKLIIALEYVLTYFESNEKYEQCAKIRDVLNQVKSV